ncbi:MAG: SRPBCC family protein [Acidimicrobiia bacterium]
MKTIESSIDIDAAPEKVWAILMDFDSYPDWNPFITSIKGEQRLGGKLEAYLDPPGGKGMTFKPTVVAFEEGTELTWLGRLLLPGVFDGRHTLRVEPRDGGSTFVHGESFGGVLTGLIMRFIGDSTELGFEQMNTALKARAEAG